MSNADVRFIYLLWTDVRNIKGLAFLVGNGVVDLLVRPEYNVQTLKQSCAMLRVCVAYYSQILPLDFSTVSVNLTELEPCIF